MKSPHASWIVFAVLTLVSTAASGVAQRTFVASNGADTNPCSINLPCRSFGAAIAQTLTGGEVIVQDSAGYGIVTITKSTSIIAPTGVYAGVSVFGGQTGITVNGAGIIVVLRGLSINGVGGNVGVYFTNSGSRLRIENCVVSGLASTGILQDATASEMIVVDTIVRDNDGAGIVVSGDTSAVIDGVRVEHNVGSGVTVSSSVGGANATIRNSVVAHNGDAGIAAFMPPSPATNRVVVENSLLAQNVGEGAVLGGITNGQVIGMFSRNVITGNGLSGISASGMSTGISSVDTFQNTFSGNGGGAIKVDGFLSQVFMSQNHFALDSSSGLQKLGGGFLGAYGNNSGNGGGLTSPESLF